MVAPVNFASLPQIGSIEGWQPSQPAQKAGTVAFADVLEGAIASANLRYQQAATMGEAFAAGARDDIHGTMLALSKADIELRMIGSARNKVIDAFYELWRMQV
jgi:flagellar hook-basal body complex protein FliE